MIGSPETFPEMAAFGQWLQARADEIVGGVCESWSCPLALWLNKLWGGQWSVNGMHYRDWECEVWKELPEWAKMFVVQLDHTYAGRDGVLGSEALAVLVRVQSGVWAA